MNTMYHVGQIIGIGFAGVQQAAIITPGDINFSHVAEVAKKVQATYPHIEIVVIKMQSEIIPLNHESIPH